MKSKYFLILLSIVLVIVEGVLSVGVVAQETPVTIRKQMSIADVPPLSNPMVPINCEAALLYMEDAILRGRKTTENSLILINHSGTGESKRIASLRFKQVAAYMGKSGTNGIVATGADVKGHGTWDLYLGGKLLYSLPLFKNEGFNLVGGCIN